jgi:hypothetical protein
MRFASLSALCLALLCHLALACANPALIVCTHPDGAAAIELTDSCCCAGESPDREASDRPASLPQPQLCACNCVDASLSVSAAHTCSIRHTVSAQASVEIPTFTPVVVLNIPPSPVVWISPHSRVLLTLLSTVVLNI